MESTANEETGSGAGGRADSEAGGQAEPVPDRQCVAGGLVGGLAGRLIRNTKLLVATAIQGLQIVSGAVEANQKADELLIYEIH